MTRSKLSLLQDLFGDSILTWQHFFFIEKHVISFRRNQVILRTFVISLQSLDMPYDQDENIFPCVEFNIV